MSVVLGPMSSRKAPSGCMPVDQAEDDLVTKEIVAGIILSIDTRVRALLVMIALPVFLGRLFA